MSIRDAISTYPRAVSAITAGIVGIGIILLVWRGCSTGGMSKVANGRKSYFTVDDGKTYFEDWATRIPPFTRDGKTAYRARVVQCGTGQPYVSHLEKYAEPDRQRLEERMKDPKSSAIAADFMFNSQEQSIMIKKPLTGDTGWVAFSQETAKKYDAIVKATCPDGSHPRPVLPN